MNYYWIHPLDDERIYASGTHASAQTIAWLKSGNSSVFCFYQFSRTKTFIISIKLKEELGL